MLPVAGRTGIISGCDGILAPNPAIQAFRDQFPKQRFRDFVALCEEKEQETGEPVLLIGWF